LPHETEEENEYQITNICWIKY